MHDPSTDPKQRYERALLRLGARLADHAIAYRLVVDDGRGGDKLGLVARLGDELVELALQRHDARTGAMWLFTEGRMGIVQFAEAIAGVSTAASRLATVERGCLLTVDALAQRLAAQLVRRQPGFPRPSLCALRRAFPTARAMAGVTATVRPAAITASSLEPTGFKTACAASVPTVAGRRCARWVSKDAGFYLPRGARRELSQRLNATDSATLRRFAVAGVMAGAAGQANEDDDNERRLETVADLADLSCDACDSFACDFDASCFDCSPDCGSLDCVPLDCGF